MDRGAWQATSPWGLRVGHNLATDPPPPEALNLLVAAALSGRLWSCPGEVLLLCIFPAFRPSTPEGDIRILK